MNNLSREDMIKVIEGKGNAEHIPMIYGIWVNVPAFGENEKLAAEYLSRYPNDAVIVPVFLPGMFEGPEDDKSYCWVRRENPIESSSKAIDSQIAISDWDELDDILEHFPSAKYPNLLPYIPAENGQYRLLHWWYWLFERHWSLRGMENALTDYYLYPDKVHSLFAKLTDFYCDVLERGKNEGKVDGVFLSDDIGTQAGPFFSLEIFREFFKPYYRRFIEKAHSLYMHVWMHTCGNVEMYIPDFIELGLDVLHPIQKHTMQERKIAEKYGDKLCIFAGFDVQQTIPYGTVEDVRRETRFLIDTYARKDGRFMLTMGNGTTPDCPIESLFALLDESYNYGKVKVNDL